MGYNVDDSPCLNKNETCVFRIVNGSILTAIGVTGTILSAFTIYCLVRHVKLPYRQNLYILNVSVSGVTIALLGLVRGLGIVSSKLVGYDSETGKQNWWCATYTFVGNTLWMSTVLVLLPLTLDRFIAVVFPLHYKTFMTTTRCKILVAMTWSPLLVILVYDTVMLSGGAKMIYQPQYHRCIFQIDRSWKKTLCTLIPLIAIIVLYAVMLIFLKKAKIEAKKFLIISSLIIAAGLITHLPDQLLISFKVHMSYEMAQITTVTFWYTNPIWNPIIYFCINKQTQQDLAATDMGKRISVAARRISSISDQVSDGAVVITRRLSSLDSYHATSTPNSNNMFSIHETPESPGGQNGRVQM